MPETTAVAMADERLLLHVLTCMRPAVWRSLRCICQDLKQVLAEEFLAEALRRLPILDTTEGDESLRARFAALVDGATVILPPGRHRWSGKLYTSRLRIFGLPGAKIRGKVLLAEGSSGSFWDVQFENEDAGAVRLQSACWQFHNCSFECSDPDSGALTAVSSLVLLRECTLFGTDTGLITRPCWIGILAKGATDLQAAGCRVGPCVQRGVVAIDDAELSLSSCRIESCEEIALRINGGARLSAQKSELVGGGVALHVGSTCTGSLELHQYRITAFEALWGANDKRPLHLDMATTDVCDIGRGCGGLDDDGIDAEHAL